MTFNNACKNIDQTDLRESWQTPIEFFQGLHAELNFTLDACASESNALLPRYWTKEQDCRNQSWAGERVFCNPPYNHLKTIIPKAVEAEICLFLFPVTSLATNYIGQYPPQLLVLPHRRIRFNCPAGLDVANKFTPSLGTVILYYGKEKVNLMKFGTEFRSDKWN